MTSLTFRLITPEGVKFSQVVYEVILPTSGGQIAVLPNHTSLTTLAVAGAVAIRRHFGDPDTALEYMATSGGFITINPEQVCLLADTAEHAHDIDELRAQEALEHARELQQTAQDHVSLADATRLIERNLVRLKVAELRHRHHKT